MIYTWSKFNYGQSVTTSNQYISFKEGTSSTELIATIAVGDYALGEFAQSVQDAMNAVGTLNYMVSLSRSGNQLTITGASTFKLLTHTASVTSTAFSLMGFMTTATDLTGLSTYTGDSACGVQYVPQFLLQSYVSPNDYIESVEATVNQSADGRVEVVRFGIAQKIEMEIKFITSLKMDGIVIRNNPNGLQNARDFLSYITQKKRFEFVPDLTTPTTYYKVLLEKSDGYADGTGFKLKELFDDGICDVYETGILTLRVVI